VKKIEIQNPKDGTKYAIRYTIYENVVKDKKYEKARI